MGCCPLPNICMMECGDQGSWQQPCLNLTNFLMPKSVKYFLLLNSHIFCEMLTVVLHCSINLLAYENFNNGKNIYISKIIL